MDYFCIDAIISRWVSRSLFAVDNGPTPMVMSVKRDKIQCRATYFGARQQHP